MVTPGNKTFTLNMLLTHSLARAKIARQEITAEHQQIAKECLSIAFGALQNEKMPMWCQESIMVPIYENEEKIVLPDGTIDVLSAFYRQLQRVGDSYATSVGGVAQNVGDGLLTTSCTQVSADGNIQVQFLLPTAVTIVGLMPNGDNFYNLTFEASNDAVTWTALQSVEPPEDEIATPYPNARWAWYEITSPANSLFFRVRETSGGILNLRELVLASQPLDTLMFRMNRDQYVLQPNKKVKGNRPLQYWLNRTLDQPTMYLWPVPSESDTFNNIYLWRRRYIQLIRNFNQTIELPVRWYDAICWRTAFYCAAEIPEAQANPKELLAFSAVPKSDAISEERDRSPIIIRPNLRKYFRR